jgi:hypothetical protein
MSVDYKHNTAELTLGNGELLYNGIGVGYLNGDDAVKFKGGYDLEKFKASIPKTVKAIFNKESMMELTAPIMQINPANLSMAMGGLGITTANGSPVTNATPKQLTFAPWPAAPGFQAIVLDGPNVTALTLKNSGGTATFSADTVGGGAADYHLDPTTGIVYRLPGGTIPAGATVQVFTQTYTPPANFQLNFGNLTQLAQLPLLFRHLRPDSTLVEIYMDLAINSNALELDFNGGKMNMMNVQFEAIYSEANSRLGYVKFTPNATLQTTPVIS